MARIIHPPNRRIDKIGDQHGSARELCGHEFLSVGRDGQLEPDCAQRDSLRSESVCRSTGAISELGRHLHNGLFFTANYSWAHNISDAQGDAPNGFQGETRYGLADLNRFGIRDNRGNVAGTRRQRFLLSGSYDLPFGQGRRCSSSSRYIDRAFGGWALNTITLLETGPYLTRTISCGFDQTNTAPFLAGSVCRPDMVGDPFSANQPGKIFNIKAFQPTPLRGGP
jgi:hypothetical protein